MAWSTRQLADLAGTTVKAVRHYHQIDLLEEPERASNGYKQYQVSHLVSLLRIKRLTELGVPLAQVAMMGQANERPDEALQVLDAELSDTIERLERVRAELGVILHHRSPTDLPAGFGVVASELSDADRALLLIYSRVFTTTAMNDLRQMLEESRRNPADADFDALAGDADESTRQELAERYAPHLKSVVRKYPWLENPGVYAPRGEVFAATVIGQAVLDLYNPAQVDVLSRAQQIITSATAP